MKKIKEKRVIITILIIIAIAVALSVYFVKQNKKEEGKSETPEQGAIEEQEVYNLIDMNNTENVEIVGDTKENNSEKLKQEKTFLGLKVSDIRLVAENGLTNFTAKVENIGDTDFKEKTIVIIFKNQDGTEYARLNGYLPDIKKGESNQIDASTTSDLSNAYDFTIISE